MIMQNSLSVSVIAVSSSHHLADLSLKQKSAMLFEKLPLFISHKTKIVSNTFKLFSISRLEITNFGQNFVTLCSQIFEKLHSRTQARHYFIKPRYIISDIFKKTVTFLDYLGNSIKLISKQSCFDPSSRSNSNKQHQNKSLVIRKIKQQNVKKKIKNHSIFYYKITPNQLGVKSHQHGRPQSFSATFVISPQLRTINSYHTNSISNFCNSNSYIIILHFTRLFTAICSLSSLLPSLSATRI